MKPLQEPGRKSLRCALTFFGGAVRRLMSSTTRCGLWLAFVALCGAGSSVRAVTVTNLYDTGPGSLRQSIVECAVGGTIVFDPSLIVGTIRLTSAELVIAKNLTIIGPGARNLTISGESLHRVFNIPSGHTVTLVGLTIANGKDAGANGVDGMTLSPDGDCMWSIPHNTPSSSGAGAVGGGILNGGTLTVSNCVFSGNEAVGGNGGNGGGADCPATGLGYNVDSYTTAPSDGGSAIGGAIYNSGTLVLIGCTLLENAARGGTGGSYIRSAPAFLYLKEYLVNGATGGSGAGGAIYNAGTATCTECTMTGNIASGGHGGHGGLYRNGGDPVGGTGGNGGNTDGGAIHSSGRTAPISFISCTLSGNSAAGGLGGDGGFGDIQGPRGAGGQALGGGTYAPSFQGVSGRHFLNTIVAGNSATVAGSPVTTGSDVYGWVTDHGFNLIGMIDGSNGWSVSIQLGTAPPLGTPMDPKLGVLQDNGGPTPTMMPLAGSAAIDNGTDAGLTADQRGYPRTAGVGTDIGAVEFNSVLPVDIGLRAYDGTATIKIACEDGTITSPLRIAKNGKIYGIILVDPAATDASKIQIKIPSGIKAWKKLP